MSPTIPRALGRADTDGRDVGGHGRPVFAKPRPDSLGYYASVGGRNERGRVMIDALSGAPAWSCPCATAGDRR